MEFHDAANFLFDLRRYPPRTGTAATRDFLSHLDDPQESVRAIQIAGSNGKGSTARMTERVLREAGLDVGLYTSPHLDDVRERVRINGHKLTEGALVEFVETTKPYITDSAADGDAPTFFETLTVMALWAFRRAEVDVAVLEVGIGGRYDATSAVDPVASAVTTVTIEHTDLLGDTVAEIARDKAHVAPDDAPLVTGATGDAREAAAEVAGDLLTVGPDTDDDCTVAYAGRDGLEAAISIDSDGRRVDTKLPLLGEHQARNAGVAAVLARQAADVNGDDLARGLRNAHWPGRFEVMSREPLIVLDGAHNPGGCDALAGTLASFEYEELHVVVGAMSDKDHRGIAAALPEADYVVACEPDLGRAEDDDVLARAFEAEGDATVETRSDVAGAFETARETAGPDDCVLVTGSLYCVAEARTGWTRPTVPKRVDSIAGARETLADAHVTDAGVWRMGGKGVHRVLRTRVQPRQAQYLKEEMLSLGGECSVSGLADQDRENVEAVLMGTLAQFKRLAGKLDGQPYGLSPLSDDIRAALEIEGHGPDDRGYPWDDGTAVMGILNVTPDSFHDGGEYDALGAAVARAEEMVDHGVDIVDVGGESTRPGADPVPADEEIDRVVPVIEQISDLDTTVAVDTRKAAVARAALDAGADILNDVSGLEDPEMRLVAADHDVPVVVMHSEETPVDPDTEREYDDVVTDVLEEVTERILLAEKAGLDREQIIVDPGLGFGKSPTEDFELLGRVDEFQALGCPVLVGHSHKSMFGCIDRGPDERLAATVAATTIAAERGADIVRVHDVEENVAAVRAVDAANDPTATDE
ncbi:dihydropteroate synthase [Halorientalis sp.]|uniref:dihydropteroate synthase n=1 Tax=Halorientalis sp. TaxID=1931229 RepID=UPI002631A4C3|nr:dihydropteroate synthase [Halorientalis sp.]